jgi:hypothetical protein
MKLPRLDFTNSRDAKGYRIKGETKLPRSQSDWRRILDPWPATKREGELVEGGPWISGHIVSMGGKQERVSLNQFPEAFKDFVAVKTPSDLVNFIARYGPLTKAKSQDVLPLLVQARIMRECIRKGESESWFHFLNLQACLFKDRKTGALEVSMTPSC